MMEGIAKIARVRRVSLGLCTVHAIYRGARASPAVCGEQRGYSGWDQSCIRVRVPI